MRAFVIFLVIYGWGNLALTQNRFQTETEKQPYFLVDSFTVDLNTLIISSEKIESVTVLKDSNAVAAYGDKAKYGAVIIKTKPAAKLLRIRDIFTKYNIPAADQHLRIGINKTIINNPELILIEENELLGVEISTDRFWIHPEDDLHKERYINIKTLPSTNKGKNH
jgi:TonB-dependent SusC/RagA subfamily outer membrane receptor